RPVGRAHVRSSSSRSRCIAAARSSSSISIRVTLFDRGRSRSSCSSFFILPFVLCPSSLMASSLCPSSFVPSSFCAFVLFVAKFFLVPICGSLQTLQILNDRLQISVRQILLRHLVARLERLRVSDPLRHVIARVLECRRRDHVATADLRQVWTNVRTRGRAVNRMTHHTRRPKEDLLPAFLRITQGRYGLLCLVLSPCVELFLRLGDYPQRHLRVLKSAVFGALPAIDARLVGLQPHRADFSRNQIFFTGEVRHPETVNHIRATQREPHRHADWNVNLIRGGEDVAGIDVVVTNFPPPLMPGQF